jgi:hypothetical protein
MASSVRRTDPSVADCLLGSPWDFDFFQAVRLLAILQPDRRLLSGFYQTPVRLVERSLWSGVISNDDYLKNSSFFLAVNAKIGVDELITKVPLRCLIASPDKMKNLTSFALPGITLRHTPTPPAAIPFKLNNQHFILNQAGRIWERIVQSHNISVFIPPEIAEAQHVPKRVGYRHRIMGHFCRAPRPACATGYS